LAETSVIPAVGSRLVAHGGLRAAPHARARRRVNPDVGVPLQPAGFRLPASAFF
jgi:hypothetical protein